MSSKYFTIIFYMLFPALYLACSDIFCESKPEIQAFPSKVVKKGCSVTIRCSSPYYQGMFRLYREINQYDDSKRDVYEENFTVTSVQEYYSNNYYCMQYSCDKWSKKSDHLTLKVIASKPEIQAFPSKVVKKGDSVAIRCSSPYYQGIFRLYREINQYDDSKRDVYEENFTVTNVQEYNPTNIYCMQYSCRTWSEQSDHLTLKVIDPREPQISYLLDGSENKQLLITCTAPIPPEECRVKRFVLHSGMVEITDLSTIEGSTEVMFTVSNLTAEYRCSYVLEVKDHPLQIIKSPHSNTITPTIPEDKERRESTEGDEKETIDTERDNGKVLNSDILIPVVATVCGSLALILILIVMVYTRRKNKSSPQKMKPSEFPQSGEADTTAEVTYCAVDENGIRATPQVDVDMKDTTMENYNDDGITYAELNKISLKQNTQSFTPIDTSLYAEVKKK